jgi:hypothetical protein
MARKARFTDAQLAQWVYPGIVLTPGRRSREDLVQYVWGVHSVVITRDEVSRGVACLRDQIPPDWALISNPSGIYWSNERQDVQREHLRRIKAAQTIVRRGVRGAVIPYLRATQPSTVTTLEHLADLVQRELEFLGTQI